MIATARTFLLGVGLAGILTSAVGSPRWSWVYPVEIGALCAGLVLVLAERRPK